MIFIDHENLSPLLQKQITTHSLPVFTSKNEKQSATPLKLLTNSESCLPAVKQAYPNHPHVKLFELVKNKAAFRELIAPITPPFFHKLTSLAELQHYPLHTLPYPIVIKPNKGYSSVGVHVIQHVDEMENVLQTLLQLQKNYTKDSTVVQLDQWLLEEWIDGPEFAIDCYLDTNGQPVILSILQHYFANEKDTSDQLYVTSKEIVHAQLDDITTFLHKLAPLLGTTHFPFHLEVRKTKQGYVPIELNPLRFAGAGTTDIAQYAYGVSTSVAYLQDEIPPLRSLFQDQSTTFYGFVVAELPPTISIQQKDQFQHLLLQKQFSRILEYRLILAPNDRTVAIIFFETDSEQELQRIVQLRMEEFLQ